MVNRCPHCGKELSKPLKDGLSSCIHCNVIFDSCMENRLLSAAWELLRSNNLSFERFLFISKLNKSEAYFVYNIIEEECCSMDNFRKIVKNIKELPCPSRHSA